MSFVPHHTKTKQTKISLCTWNRCPSAWGFTFQALPSDWQMRDCSSATTCLIMSPNLWCTCTSCCAEHWLSSDGVILQLRAPTSERSPSVFCCPAGGSAVSFSGSPSAGTGSSGSSVALKRKDVDVVSEKLENMTCRVLWIWINQREGFTYQVFRPRSSHPGSSEHRPPPVQRSSFLFHRNSSTHPHLVLYARRQYSKGG